MAWLFNGKVMVGDADLVDVENDDEDDDRVPNADLKAAASLRPPASLKAASFPLPHLLPISTHFGFGHPFVQCRLAGEISSIAIGSIRGIELCSSSVG